MEKIYKQGDREPIYSYNGTGTMQVSWYWKICEHNPKKHGMCIPLGDGLCGVKAIRYKVWNSGKWENEPMVNHATPEQEKVLDNTKWR